MTIPTILIFYVLTMAVIFSLVAVVWWIPADLESLFRYRLWKLRDEVSDAIIDQKLDPNSRLVNGFVRSLESAIYNSKNVNPVFQLVLYGVPDETRKSRRIQTARDLKLLPKEQRKLLRGYMSDYSKAIGWHLFFGSPTGWLFAATLGMLCGAVAICVGVFLLAKYGSNPFRYAFVHCSRAVNRYTSELAMAFEAIGSRDLLAGGRPQLLQACAR